MNPEGTCEEIRQLCLKHQAAAFGFAALASIRTDDFLLPESLPEELPTAVSIAMRLSPAVLSTLTDHPNQLYEHHYRQLNFALDRLALAVANHIQSLDHSALPIPASQIIDWQNQRAHLSHKRIAVAAGLGWLGRNNLLVTPEYGSQVRLVTVLTGLPWAQDMSQARPGKRDTEHGMRNDCGSCRTCIGACPAHAIGETPQQFNHLACHEKLKEFQRQRYVSQYICGLCVRACPGSTGRRLATGV